jgi:hypothetical protein
MQSVTFSNEVCEFYAKIDDETEIMNVVNNNNNSSSTFPSTFTSTIHYKSVLSKTSKYPRYNPDDDYPCKLLRGGNYLIMNRHGKILKLMQSQWHDNTWFAGKAQQAIEHHSQQMVKRRERRFRDLRNDNKENEEPFELSESVTSCSSSSDGEKLKQTGGTNLNEKGDEHESGNNVVIGKISDLINVDSNADFFEDAETCQTNSQQIINASDAVVQLASIKSGHQQGRRRGRPPKPILLINPWLEKPSVETTHVINYEKEKLIRTSTRRKFLC